MAEPPAPQSTLEVEHARLARAARERRSVDSFARAAVEGFGWAILSGVCGKIVWDSARLPLFFYPLALLDLLLLWDAVRAYGRARAQLRDERLILRRLLEVRGLLGIDSAPRDAAPPAAIHQGGQR